MPGDFVSVFFIFLVKFVFVLVCVIVFSFDFAFGHKMEWLPIESMPGVDWKLASPHGRNSPAMPTTVSLARTIYAQKIAQTRLIRI